MLQPGVILPWTLRPVIVGPVPVGAGGIDSQVPRHMQPANIRAEQRNDVIHLYLPSPLPDLLGLTVKFGGLVSVEAAQPGGGGHLADVPGTLQSSGPAGFTGRLRHGAFPE